MDLVCGMSALFAGRHTEFWLDGWWLRGPQVLGGRGCLAPPELTAEGPVGSSRFCGETGALGGSERCPRSQLMLISLLMDFHGPAPRSHSRFSPTLASSALPAYSPLSGPPSPSPSSPPPPSCHVSLASRLPSSPDPFLLSPPSLHLCCLPSQNASPPPVQISIIP